MTLTTQISYTGNVIEEADQTAMYFSGNPFILELKKLASVHINDGFAHSKDEEYKYTKPELFNSSLGSFGSSNDKKQAAIDNELLQTFDSKIHLLQFFNGRLDHQASRIETESNGVYIGSIHGVPAQIDIKRYLNCTAQANSDVYTHLNTAMFSDILVVYIPDGVTLENDIFISEHYESIEKISTAPRILFIAGVNSSARVIHHYTTSGDSKHSSVLVTEIFGDKNSKIDWLKIQEGKENSFAMDQTFAELKDGAHFSIHTFALSGTYCRNNLIIRLLGRDIEAHLNGLYLAGKNRLIDNHTLVDHIAPHSVSYELYKGIAGHNGTGIFNGKVFVRQAAQKTNAFQENKNLLLSDEAHMYAKPQLEIFADDVKCSHGATTGQLDEEALFYLQSRGIGFNEAREMLMHAYSAELINKVIQDPIKTYLTRKAEENFPD
ncbi:MAG TPA: Fe-S cluster assembly protein SufD [Bacteroidia bacterium]|nr:Fe-S cluster assembly protein SufD [Bacteroidia bacterium]HNT79870.1 Fe-S cluster assembly protein SufD [Bacteroidia bacterium]